MIGWCELCWVWSKGLGMEGEGEYGKVREEVHKVSARSRGKNAGVHGEGRIEKTKVERKSGKSSLEI